MTATPALGLASPHLQPLLDDIRARRDDLHRLGHISQDIVEQFQKIGLYRAFVPEQFGGGAMTPMEFLRLIETISAADGSAGWVASFGFASKYLSSLPAATLSTLYRETPDVGFAG
ncbi:MAG TPA: acyl-CoA dehydrogenase family protein, partial [Sphingopyxis sp.]|nr:acyl-CoA dehydrogenase family protein [Sphingopyxis sp.]